MVATATAARPKRSRLLHYILRNIRGIRILHIMSVNTESRKPLLCMGCQNACQIYGAGTLCSVKAPYTLYGSGIHIHRFCAIAPAGCYCQSNIHAFLAEFVRTCRCSSHTSDGSVCDDNLYRLAIGITKVFLQTASPPLSPYSWSALPETPHLKIASSSVNRRSDANYRIIPHISVFCHFLSLLVKITQPVSLRLSKTRQYGLCPLCSV